MNIIQNCCLKSFTEFIKIYVKQENLLKCFEKDTYQINTLQIRNTRLCKFQC